MMDIIGVAGSTIATNRHVNVNVNNLLVKSESFDNSGEPGPQAKSRDMCMQCTVLMLRRRHGNLVGQPGICTTCRLEERRTGQQH